jgi:prefoldin subunit 5
MAPALPPEIPQFYVPARGRKPAGCLLVYKPRILGAARVSFSDVKSRVSETKACQYLVEVTDSAIPVEWESAEASETAISDLERGPDAGEARYANLPSPAGSARNYAAWTRDFSTWLYGSQALELFYSASTKEYSKPGESERDFRVRVAQGAREQRDDAVDTLRKKYAPKMTTLQERLRKAKASVQREKEQARNAGLQAAVSIGSSLLGAFTGRKIRGASTAARGIGRSMSEKQDINRAEDTVEAMEKQLADLNAEFEAETADLASRIDPATEELQTVTVKPKKADIIVNLVALAWVPYWQDETGSVEPAF